MSFVVFASKVVLPRNSLLKLNVTAPHIFLWAKGLFKTGDLM